VYNAPSVRVIDGDTVSAVLDLGFHIAMTQTLRLAGLNCGEHGTPVGDAATVFVQGLVQRSKSIVIVTDANTRQDNYGRYLATVWIDGVNVNAQLIALGYALPYSGSGPKPVPAWPLVPAPTKGLRP